MFIDRLLTDIFVLVNGIVIDYMLNSMFDELKAVNLKSIIKHNTVKKLKRLKSPQVKVDAYLEPKRASTHGAFLWKCIIAYYFHNKSSIIDVRLGYIWVSKNIEIFKVKLRWSKSSRLLQCIVFLVRCTWLLSMNKKRCYSLLFSNYVFLTELLNLLTQIFSCYC